MLADQTAAVAALGCAEVAAVAADVCYSTVTRVPIEAAAAWALQLQHAVSVRLTKAAGNAAADRYMQADNADKE